MPPYKQFIEGVSEPARFFYRSHDGEYVPLTEIQNITLLDEIKYDPSVIYPLWTETGELSFSISLTHKSSRRMRKMMQALKNSMMRSRRTAMRRKEKARRTLLKEGTL